MAVPNFAALDYVVLVGFLALSAGIGVFVAWQDRRKRSSKHFLTGNRQLSWLPVSLSMMASYLSSIGILGQPSEVFLRGSTLWVSAISSTMSILVAAFVFLPMYYNMDITSINEYLEKRFMSTAIRNIASIVFIMSTLLYMGVVLYGPALALGSVTGIPVWSSILLNGFVCTFYTAIGGIKAVIWTDVVQMVLMFAGYIMVIVSGLQHLGGFENMWRIASDGGRVIFFNFSTSVYDTYTSWNVLLGYTVIWMVTYCSSQTQVQRYSSMKSLKRARRALLLNIPGVAANLLLSVLSGMTLYAVYGDCDPRLTGDINKADQLMPHAVQDLLRDYPGLSGLLVAAVLSGSLSTLSSGYNALAAVTWDDFVRPRVNISEGATLRLTKAMAAAYGLFSISIAFLAGTMESIIQAASSLVGALSGPLLAMFVLGIFFPCCKKKGAITGTLAALATSWWLSLGSIVHPREADDLPTSTTGCADFNQTITAGSYDPPPIPSGIFRFYHISFVWICTIGFTTHMVVSLFVSLIFERNEKEEVDPKYICPFVRRYMSNYVRKPTENELKESQRTKNGVSPTELKRLMQDDQ
ncbi:sodium-coupled monocarboxylate transporter 2-like [Dermacentor albipictus]|uniref:sodium-coupled monocarboxylate transporter 2-like n=1 Tax=Dermacentor albipictus TaxID=60249 RepID=UPI0038FC9CE3